MIPKPNTNHNWIDISSEQVRTYYFGDGSTVEVKNPQWLAISNSGGHRLVTASGEGTYVASGWFAIKWKPREGQPTFVA